MNSVACIAQGGSAFSNKGDLYSHIHDAVLDLFSSVPAMRRDKIDGVLVSTNENSKYLASEVARSLQLHPKCAHTVESLCSSGTNAIVSAYAHIQAGLADTMLVIGADQKDGPGQVLDTDISRGRFSRPIYWASLFASSYKRKFSIDEKEIATVSAKNHTNAKDNPRAMHLGQCTTKDVLESKKITADLHLYECSRSCTGATAILLASENAIKELECKDPVWLSGIGQNSDSSSISHIQDFSIIHSASDAAKSALQMAKISPSDIDVAELHDAFAICEPMILDALGICEKGKGAKLCTQLYETGDKMINPRGGLLGAGHPLGATGVAQVAEIVSQLAGTASLRQVERANVGLVHNMSAAGTSSTVLVLKNER